MAIEIQNSSQRLPGEPVFIEGLEGDLDGAKEVFGFIAVGTLMFIFGGGLDLVSAFFPSEEEKRKEAKIKREIRQARAARKHKQLRLPGIAGYGR